MTLGMVVRTANKSGKTNFICLTIGLLLDIYYKPYIISLIWDIFYCREDLKSQNKLQPISLYHRFYFSNSLGSNHADHLN